MTLQTHKWLIVAARLFEIPAEAIVETGRFQR